MQVWMALIEKQIPFDSMLVDLRNKPKWYPDMVKNSQTPAIKIDGKFVYASRHLLPADLLYVQSDPE